MKKVVFSCLVALLASPISGAWADSAQDSAYDKRDNFVSDTRGHCVRTKWMGNEDPCAPKAPEPARVVAPAPQPEPAPAPEPEYVITKDERTVYFDFDSAVLTADAQSKLQNLATLINASSRVSDVRIVGFTDQFGSDSYNQALSQKRVDAVRSYLDPLLTLDISSSEFEFRAAGKAPKQEECEAVKNRKARIECMSVERRVEIELLREHQK